MPLSRRDFLWRMAKASALLTALGAGAFKWMETPRAARKPPAAAQTPVFNFSAPGAAPMRAVDSGPERRKTLTAALAALGGMKAFIRSGDRVLIKVNAAFATPPAIGATTHPEVVEETIRLCFEAGARDVVVTDYPINDPPSCFRISGIAEATRRAGGRLHIPSSADFEPLRDPTANLLRDWPMMLGPFRFANKLIGTAPVKDHARSGASMTLKNWYGFLGGQRALFHQRVHELISELAALIRPTLVILDGTATMFRNGPTGGSFSDLKPTNRMIVSSDPVAADALGATLLGRRVSDLPFITKAAAAGAGTANYELLNPVQVNAI